MDRPAKWDRSGGGGKSRVILHGYVLPLKYENPAKFFFVTGAHMRAGRQQVRCLQDAHA